MFPLHCIFISTSPTHWPTGFRHSDKKQQNMTEIDGNLRPDSPEKNLRRRRCRTDRPLVVHWQLLVSARWLSCCFYRKLRCSSQHLPRAAARGRPLEHSQPLHRVSIPSNKRGFYSKIHQNKVLRKVKIIFFARSSANHDSFWRSLLAFRIFSWTHRHIKLIALYWPLKVDGLRLWKAVFCCLFYICYRSENLYLAKFQIKTETSTQLVVEAKMSACHVCLFTFIL